jgi:4-hydroxybenzoate polyprenyltransferase
MGGIYFVGVAAATAHLMWQTWTLKINDEARCLMLFRSNRDFGLIVFAAIVAGRVFI